MPSPLLAGLTPSRVIVSSRWFLTGSLPVTPAPVPVHAPVVLPGERAAAWAVAAFHGITGQPWLLAVTAGFVIAVIAGWQSARTSLHQWRHRRLAEHAQEVLITPPPEADPAGTGLWWANLAGLLRPARWRALVYGTPHIGFEFRWAGRQLQILVWVPGTVPAGPVAAAARAAWPGASTRIQDATPPLTLRARTASPASSVRPAGREGGLAAPGASPGRRVPVFREAGAALAPLLPAWFPLEAEHDVDLLRALIAAGSGLHATEQACVQILARPAAPTQIRKARAGAAALKTGAPAPAGGGAGRIVTAALNTVLDLVTPARTTARPAAGGRAGGARPGGGDPLRERDARPGLDKVAAPQWEVAIRLAVTSTSTRRTPSTQKPRERTGTDTGPDDAGRRLSTVAHGLASAMAVHDGRNRFRRLRLARPSAVLASRVMRSGFLLSAAELTAIAGLPSDVAVPGLDRARAKAAPAPIAVPAGGRGTKTLGRSLIGGHSVALPVTDARQHLHVLGSTGVGKSTLMCHLILDDIRAGRGVVLIDPKGDLAQDVLDRYPLTAASRLTLIDPDQPAGGAHFNPLQVRPGGDADVTVDQIVSIFANIFQRHWGPRIDDVLRVACLTLMRHPNPTLANIPPLLNSKQFRAPFTVGLTDPEGLLGFWQWYESTPPQLRAQIIGPVLARLRSFLLRDFVKGTIGAARSSFDMGQILNGGVLIARLPKGQLGDDASRLLGSLTLGSVWQAATARARIPEAKRRDATVYVDESHNVLNLAGSVTDMLAEARGYHLSLVLAHQDLAQLPRDTQLALSANARNKIYFTCSPEDSRQLARHTLPELDEHDLSHLDAYTAATRLVIGNRETAAFSLTTSPPAPPTGDRDQIRRAVTEAAAARERTDLEDQRAGQSRPAPSDPDDGPADDPPGDPAASGGALAGRVEQGLGGPRDQPRARPGSSPGQPETSKDNPTGENPQAGGHS